MTLGVLFVATSLVSSGSQKKVYSSSDFGRRDDGDALILDRKSTSFMFSASGIQKKERSVMGFIHGDTGNEEIFIGDVIRRVLTC